MGQLKRRSNTVINMQLLALLIDGPRGPSRIAQALGLNFYKFQEFAAFQESKGFIRKEVQGEYELYYITEKGIDVYHKWTEFYSAFGEDTYLR
jgi:predicted transcriptional regulator